ncbi:hypothetical protein N7509_001427 [Penicillium cosmopolitanum]|uniref:Intradiol ring-cleavage dioxygenases domain-containing protein n=1 Tax=Penicillium cosmopolitanum TaxID=1131564 RepID=A0A9X0BF42_9EURO|nr:uncharacterized protein N7509_001427 [Penicillium cosmopolitanum]KAJ5414800.1 hypothetical protein N7509_001427 [Penicillium cosmopolitanum]
MQKGITGVYSGIVSSGNGDSSDELNISSTFHRGIEESDSNGVVHFQSTFPGNYTSRATHIHVLTHPANETEVLANGTISGLYTSHSSHVGQFFFDQDLISAIEKISPYTTNTQDLTTNAHDSILAEEADAIQTLWSMSIWAMRSLTESLLGSLLRYPRSLYTEQGGPENESSGGMGGGGGGNGCSPPGASTTRVFA